jgi:uncharacterized protein (TIGR04255 family)
MMNRDQLEALHFESPPIDEVVCGLMFDPVNEMLATHLGLLWERYKPDYGIVREVAPLANQIELAPGVMPESPLSFAEVLPLPRVWFEETNGKGLIQVQRDRFHYNWRRTRPDDAYPHFEHVVQLFEDKFNIFRSFLRELDARELQIKQFELTYVNQILLPDGLESFSNMGGVFSDFSWKADEARLRPEAMNWRLSFALPKIGGRLHATVRNAQRIQDNQPVLLFDLTARGIGEERSATAMTRWFSDAHSYIVRLFIELTTSKMQQEVWRIQR